MHKWIIWLGCWLAAWTAAAQDWAYTILGEDIFANSDIYSLYQSEDERVWVGTNNGVYVYEYGQFSRIAPAETQLGQSIFQLQTDQQGRVYCCNLSGQIFEIRQGRLVLYYQCPPSVLGSQFYFFFDSRNRLVIISKQILRISPAGNELLYTAQEHGEVYYVQTLDPHTHAIYSEQPNRMLYYRGDSLCWESVLLPQSAGGALEVGVLGGGRLFQTLDNVIYTDHPTIRCDLGNNGQERYIQLQPNAILALSPQQGARLLYADSNSIRAGAPLFKDYFLSAAAKGKGDIVLLGTFGNGILLITNPAARQTILPNGMRGLCADDKALYMAHKRGNLYRWDGDRLDIIDSLLHRSMDGVHYSKAIQPTHSSADIPPHLIYTGRIDERFGVIKDVYTVHDTMAWMATSNNVYCFGTSLPDYPYWKEHTFEYKIPFRQLKQKQRYNAVAYDPVNRRLYTASNSTVTRWQADGQAQELRYQGSAVVGTDMVVSAGKLYVATADKGLLVAGGGELQQLWAGKMIMQLLVYQDYLLVLCQQGVYVLHIQSGEVHRLGVPKGIFRKTIIDMALWRDQLALLHKDALVYIPLASIAFSEPALSFQIDSIAVNDTIRYAYPQALQLHHTQNRIAVGLRCSGLVYLEDAFYGYRIPSLGTDWQYIPAKSRQIEYAALPPGAYTLEIKLGYDGYFTKTQQVFFTIQPPYWQRWWFYLMLVLIITAILVLFYTIRIRQLQRINEVHSQKQQVEKELIDSQLKALRSQMNPHFIFNSLNAIQDLVLQQDVENSYDYIVLFSELVRNTLHYSNLDFIALDKEIQFLEVYLSLEKLRFKDELIYTITSEGDTDVEIPSLLVQPFVENALLHGLLHKKGIKQLMVAFRYTDTLTCTITDNGIGREASAAIQRRKGKGHHSFALQALERRMQILAQQQAAPVGYQVIDLVDKDGAAIGTQVVIQMPFRALD